MIIYETIYKKLDTILNLNDLLKYHAGFNIKLKSSGYMNLSVEILEKSPEFVRISMTHYGEQNGDLMADPDMEVKIYPKNNMAEAISFQNDYMGLYQVVYPEVGKVNIKLKKELNSFLTQWLSNLKIQGFKRQQVASKKV